MIKDRLKCEVYRIEASDAYPVSYDATVARNVREQNDNARPAIANPLPAIDQYDTVLLACRHLERPGTNDHDHVCRELRLHRQNNSSHHHPRYERARQHRTRLRQILSKRSHRPGSGRARRGGQGLRSGHQNPGYNAPDSSKISNPDKHRTCSTNQSEGPNQ